MAKRRALIWEAPVRRFAKFIRSDRGAAAIEYGLITALIAAVLLVGLAALGTALDTRMFLLGNAIADVWAAISGGGPAA